jgi:hypothetical protein
MAPYWLDVLAWVSLGLAFLSAAAILCDIFLRGYRQRMWIMEAVWPTTALYFGPLSLWGYARWGRPNSMRAQRAPDYGRRASAAIGVSHCGAGCTLGDIIGEWIVFALGATIAGLALFPEFIADYVLAFTIGIAFSTSRSRRCAVSASATGSRRR